MTRWFGAARAIKAFYQALGAPSIAAAAAEGPLAGMAQAAAGAARALCTSFAATAAPQPAARCLQPHPLAGRHPAGYAWLARQRLSTTCSASSGGGGAGAGAGSPPPRGRGRPSSSPGSSRGASSAVGSSDDLQRLKGVGPANEKKLQDGGILNVQDLQQVYREKCDKDVQQLAEYLQGVGIRRLHGKLIAQEVSELVAEAEAAAAEAGKTVVTLSVEGNISAGKSTFLDVLSHEETHLRDILKVVQEPVENWQAYECLDRHGRGVTANVLEKFYSDPHRYAYSFQHYVLMSRMKKDRDTRQAGKDLRVLERSIFSDRQVFVRAMHRAGTMEDFEVSVYNTIFDQEVTHDIELVPDGFVYLRANPGTCMQRMRRRNRGEEGGVSQAYLEELHANHEDWLLHGDSASAISRAAGASVLTPRPEADAAADSFLRSYTPGREMDKWKLEVIRDVPAAIKDQVLLLKGAEGLPQLQHRLALVMDHDEDIDIHNDTEARKAYASKIQTFYQFVRQWKEREQAELAELAALQAEIKAGVRQGSIEFDRLGNVVLPMHGQGLGAHAHLSL